MMALATASLLCPFTVTSDIFMLKEDTAKTHCINAGLNVPDNAPLAVYQAALAGNWLVMGFKTDSPPIDARLSKIEAVIENIASLAAADNLAVNQLMEHETTMVIKAKAMSTEEAKWTTVMANNVRQVVNQAVETLADTPKQEERKFNLRLTGFEAKEGETEKEPVQRLNTEVLQGQMKLCAKVIATMRQRPVTMWASTSTAGTHPGAVLLKFTMSEDRQATLRGRKGLAGTKLGLDDDLIPVQQACRVGVMAVVQGGQGGRQARLLACNRTFH
jgi:hypothetical protein